MNIWLLLLVAVCGLSFWLGRDLIPGRDGSAGPPEAVPVADPSYALSENEAPIHLAVLNGTGQDGLARKVSLLLGRAGCVPESVGNAPERRFTQSLLVNRRLSEDRAADLARRLGGIRVIREWDGRGSEDAVLVLGSDYAGLASSLEAER